MCELVNGFRWSNLLRPTYTGSNDFDIPSNNALSLLLFILVEGFCLFNIGLIMYLALKENAILLLKH